MQESSSARFVSKGSNQWQVASGKHEPVAQDSFCKSCGFSILSKAVEKPQVQKAGLALLEKPQLQRAEVALQAIDYLLAARGGGRDNRPPGLKHRRQAASPAPQPRLPRRMEDRMNLLTIVQVLAVVSAGLLAGIFLGDRVGFAYARPTLSPSSFVQCQQIIHRHFVKMMPPLSVTAVLAGAAWLWLVRTDWRDAEFWLIAVSTCGFVFNLIMTRAMNVPINQQLMTWSVADPPANLREMWAPWERVHTVRTVVAVGAFVLEAVALGLTSRC